MYRAYNRYILLVVFLGLLFTYSCSNSSGKRDLKTIAAIDTALAHLQPQTDTGYQPYTRYKKSLDSLEKVAIVNDYPNALSRIYFMVGSMSRWEGNFDTSLVWLIKSYNQVKGSNTLEEVNTLLEIGDVYLATGRKRLANEYFYNALFISERINSSEATTKTLFRLASAFYHQNSFRQAMKMYRKTLVHNRVTRYLGDHKTMEMRMLNNIGVCYYKLKAYDTALMYYDSALLEANRLDQTPNTVAKGVFMGNKGRIYQLKGEYKRAIKLLTTNTKINARPGGDRRDAITSFIYLAEIYSMLDSSEKFTANSDSALKYSYIVRSSDALVRRAATLGLKADFYAKNNETKKAYSYRTQQFAITDSLNRVEQKEELKDIVLYRELKENESELLSLKENSKTQETRIFIYLTMAMLAIALLIIAAIALNNYRKNLKKQKILIQQVSEQNEQINLNRTQLEQAIEELTNLNDEKNRLLGMVAHDLRGPIYNITGVVQLLESSERYSKLDESDAQLVELIKKSCDNALEVINDLLEAAKMDNDGFDVKLKSENLSEVIRDATRMYQSSAAQKDIEISYSTVKNKVITAINKEKISRAIGNLLSNAIKFSKPKNIVNVTLTEADKHAVISVSDNGMGIPQADRAIIFDKFTKAKRVGTAGEKPVGLGMSIVKQIVEAHGGRVWLESEVGKGTTFYVELPLK